jgi:hypothetical protein
MKYILIVIYLSIGIVFGGEIINPTKIHELLGIKIGDKVSKDQECGSSFSLSRIDIDDQSSPDKIWYLCKSKSSQSPFDYINIGVYHSVVVAISGQGSKNNKGFYTSSLAVSINELENSNTKFKKTIIDPNFSTFSERTYPEYLWESNGVMYELSVYPKAEEKSVYLIYYKEESCLSPFVKLTDFHLKKHKQLCK